MIIIEGTDLVGKTSVCNKICEADGNTLVYQHLSKPPENWDYLFGYIDLAAKFSVRDRFHISDIAYRAACGEQPRIDPEHFRLVDAHLRLLGTVTAVITVDDCLLEERFAARKSVEMYKLDVILKANNYYKTIAKRGRYHHYNVDIDFHFHCTREYPYINAHDISSILNLHAERAGVIGGF